MQLTGGQFTNTSAVMGNDVSTFPDIPAEIRAPAGTIPGLSGYQVNFAANDLYTAGDSPQVLVAMNPAALKANLPDLEPGRDHHRQYGSIQPQWSPQSRVREKPARRRQPQWLRRASGPLDHPDPQCPRRHRGHEQPSEGHVQECLCLGLGVLDVRPPARLHAQVLRDQIRWAGPKWLRPTRGL